MTGTKDQQLSRGALVALVFGFVAVAAILALAALVSGAIVV